MSDVASSELGRIAIAPKALARLVVAAAEQVDGAHVRRSRRGLRVELENGSVSVEIGLAARRDRVLPELGRQVQERVAETLGSMLELKVERVDVTVEEVID